MLQRNLLAGICLALLLGGSPVYAASPVSVCDPNNPSHCAVPDASGNTPITGTITASLGGFTPSAAGARMTPLSVTTADSSGSLPTGAVAVVSNAGTTNPMYCNVNGVAATTSDQLIAANSWFAFTIPNAITTLHCIATGGTTTANGVGGAGLPTGAGGGSGGGGGGAVTNAGTFATQLTGATNNINNIAGTITLPTGASTSANQSTEITALATIATNTGAAIPAGTAVIGKVTTDQTTPGTTDLVHLPTTSNGGATTVKGGVGVVNGGSTYQAVAASQTATVLQTSTGAAGDYLSHCVIYPTSTSPGVVTVFDNTNTAATSAILFAGGATSTSNLTPISVPVGAVSTAGAWKVTTGAAVSVVCFGKFS